MTRRELLGSAALAGGLFALDPAAAVGQPPPDTAPAAAPPEGPYQLTPLPYDYADLEPYLDAQTMRLHHSVHHAGYVRAANAAVAELDRIRRVGGAEVKAVRSVVQALAFNLSGHVLHDLFWRCLKKDGGGEPPATSAIGQLITRDFGHFEGCWALLAAAAAQVTGSGWGVLAYEPLAQRLLVLQAEKHENVTAWGCVPLLVLDVWEHAYYLKYQNQRAEYLKALRHVLDWEHVEQRLQRALKLT